MQAPSRLALADLLTSLTSVLTGVCQGIVPDKSALTSVEKGRGLPARGEPGGLLSLSCFTSLLTRGTFSKKRASALPLSSPENLFYYYPASICLLEKVLIGKELEEEDLEDF